MNTYIKSELVGVDSKQMLTWIVVRHFLPVRMLRELCESLIKSVSGGSHTLNDIFDQLISGDDIASETWVVRPSPITDPLGMYLRNIILSFVWQNDQMVPNATEAVVDLTKVNPDVLKLSILLSSCDFNSIPRRVDLAGYAELEAFFDSVRLCADVDSSADFSDLINSLEVELEEIPIILRAFFYKHLGDLFADVDEWRAAQSLYEVCSSLIVEVSSGGESGVLISLLEDLVFQSKSSAASAISGSSLAASMLKKRLSTSSLKANRVLITNSSIDEVDASSKGDDIFVSDTRSATLFPPLLSPSLDLSRPLELWKDRKFSDAYGRFWQVLRRQLSLGLCVESKRTKSYYAHCLLDGLCTSKDYSSNDFLFAVGMLIESENVKTVKNIKWSDILVEKCVTLESIRFVADKAAKYEGSRIYRQNVAVAIFSVWTKKLGSSEVDAASEILNYLVDTSLMLDNTGVANGVDLSTCLEAIQSIGESRPEFMALIPDSLPLLLISKLGKTKHWVGDKAVLNAANTFGSAFGSENLSKLADAVLNYLRTINPASELWVTVRPAMSFLSSSSVKDLASHDKNLGERIVESILRFSEAQNTFSTDGIFALSDFSPELLRSDAIKARLNGPVESIRAKAIQINSTATVSNIVALLVAPSIAGLEGVRDALRGFSDILTSMHGANPALSFNHASEVLRILSRNSKKIVSESMYGNDFYKDLDNIFDQVCQVWGVASLDSAVFKPFSFTSDKQPDLVAVHNWAFASLEFASSLSRLEQMKQVISSASKNTDLQQPISLALATRLSLGMDDIPDYQQIALDNRSAFYAALGRRLSVLYREKNNVDLVSALFTGVIRHGPRAADISVFTAAAMIGLVVSGDLGKSIREYEARLGGDRDLSLLLGPLVSLLITSQSGEQCSGEDE